MNVFYLFTKFPLEFLPFNSCWSFILVKYIARIYATQKKKGGKSQYFTEQYGSRVDLLHQFSGQAKSTLDTKTIRVTKLSSQIPRVMRPLVLFPPPRNSEIWKVSSTLTATVENHSATVGSMWQLIVDFSAWHGTHPGITPCRPTYSNRCKGRKSACGSLHVKLCSELQKLEVCLGGEKREIILNRSNARFESHWCS